MKLRGVIALALVAGIGTWSTSCTATAAPSVASAADAAVQLGQALLKTALRFPATAAVTAIEAQLALVVEQSAADTDVALQALDIAEAAPNLSPHAKAAIEQLKRLIRARRHNAIAALDEVGRVGGGPGFAGAGGGADYNH